MNRFQYNVEYTEEQILAVATPVNHQDEYLVADTPETEYWFKRKGHYWELSHVWGHFLLGKPTQYSADRRLGSRNVD